jgi:tetratricopeptide (TPR) repeat protein
MATVFQVQHQETGDRRALKLLLAGLERRDELRGRFASEIRLLTQLDHPNITCAYDNGEWLGRPWFAMEEVVGQDLRQLVVDWKDDPPPVRFKKSEDILVQLTSALAYIHERGLVHRDVTPGNIRVTGDGVVKLMDFGVAKAPGHDLTIAGEMVGTVAYMAPEQIRGEPVDARADLYALGAVLYLMLAGKRPFNARTLPGYLEKHLNMAPRPPRELDPFVPAHLNEIALRLLEKDPADRYGSASHLLSVLDRSPSRSRGIDMMRWPSTLVGRTGEQARLRECLAALPSGWGCAVIVESPSGYGRSRLLAEVHSWAFEMGLPVASGQCGSKDLPYGGFAEILSDMVTPDQPLAGPLEAAFRDAAGPVERFLVFSAFRDLLRERLPRVILLDDVHNAERGTSDLLAFLLRNHLGLAEDPVMFVMTRKPPEGVDPLQDLLDDPALGLLRMSLSALDRTSVEELVLQLLPDDLRSRRLAIRLQQEGEGNAHFIVEMIRGLVDEGVIHMNSEGEFTLGLELSEVTHTKLPLPSTIREALRERLEPLSARARAVAAAIAIARQEINLDVLLEAVDDNEDQLLDHIDELLDGGVARQRQVGAEEFYALTRPRLRDLLLEDLGHDQRQKLHRMVGTAMERLYRHRIDAVVGGLAWHFEQGGVPAKAYPYLAAAGRRLYAQSFVPEAMEVYDRAKMIEPQAREYLTLEEADRRLADLHLLRGRALFHTGRWNEAGEALTQADELARLVNDDHLKAQTAAELGTYYRHLHRLDDAKAHFTEALSLAERVGDPRLRPIPLHGLGAVHWAQGDLDQSRNYMLEGLSVAGTVHDDRAMGHCYNGLGLAAMCRGQSSDARKYLEQSSTTFEKLGLLAPLAIARINLVELCHFQGNLRKGLQIADRTISQAREVHHSLGIALGLRYRALILVDLGRLQEAEDNVREALRRVQEIDNREDEIGGWIALTRVPLSRGDYAAAEDCLNQVQPLLADFDAEGFTPLVIAWRARCQVNQGRLDDWERLLAEADSLSEGAWPHNQCRLDLIAARTYAALGRADDAVLRAEAALKRSVGCDYKLYTLKAHCFIADWSSVQEDVAIHRRAADRLARSLSASISRDDRTGFEAMFASVPVGETPDAQASPKRT